MKMGKFLIFSFITLLVNFAIADDFADFAQADSEMCYFPLEFHGIYVIQVKNNEPGSKVTYSEVPVEADGIPPWGRCFRRKGNQVIFKDTNGAQNCIRCFHLTLKSPNVIQIQTEGLQKCYINEEAARATCPSEKDIREKRYKEYTLFRKHVPGGLQTTENVFCPFNGRYQFVYKTERKQISCDGSELSNCPHGNALGLRFGQCKTKETASVSLDKRFLCLGSWDHFDSNSPDKFIALMDMNEDPVDRPKYRCGLYRKDSNGRINVALSSDSTCTNYLLNSSSGYETFQLTPIPHINELNQLDNMKCRFPDWAQGEWALTKIEGQTFNFRDSKNQFRQLNSRCLMRHQNSFRYTTREDRFLVHTVTQCGDEMYQCIWLKYRGPNIYEFMIGKTGSRNASIKLCDDVQFEGQTWTTQARNVAKQTTGCPIVGDYSGIVPGESSLCAKIASDCNNPDIMFYTVSLCQNKSHIFEQREYKCYGSWEEDGALLTFTQRRDMPGYQCFRGNIKRNGDEAFIAEIGESCIRGDDPSINEMKIIKQASCQRTPTASYVPVLSWDSKAADIVPNTVPKRVQTVIKGRHQDQIQSNNLPVLNTANLNNYNNQRYGDVQTSKNFHSNILHNDLNQIYPIGASNSRPQISIVKNDYYQAEQPIIKRKMVTKHPARAPPFLNNSSTLSSLNSYLILSVSLIVLLSHLRFKVTF